MIKTAEEMKTINIDHKEKTKEEILKKHFILTSSVAIKSTKGAALDAMEEFADQEVDEYKKKLRKLVRARYKSFNNDIKPSDRDQSFDSAMFELENFIEIIDTVK